MAQIETSERGLALTVACEGNLTILVCAGRSYDVHLIFDFATLESRVQVLDRFDRCFVDFRGFFKFL